MSSPLISGFIIISYFLLVRSSWTKYWNIAREKWEYECKQESETFKDGSGTEVATLPIPKSIDIEAWRRQPIVKALLSLDHVKDLVGILESLEGKPDEMRQGELQNVGSRATAAATQALEKLFDIERDSRDASPLHSRLWGAIIDHTQVGDREFVTESCRNGCPLGINLELVRSDGIHPIKEVKRGNGSVGDIFFKGNYASTIPGAEDILQKLIDEEVRKDWMMEVEDLAHGFRPARMALIPKKSFEAFKGSFEDMKASELKKYFRIVEDYRRSSTNDRVEMHETNTVPGYSSLSEMLTGLRGLSRKYDLEYTLFESDVESAYRILPISAEEQHCVGVQIGNRKFVHKRVPMGLRSSAYLWSREYSSLHRALRVLMWLAANAGLCLLDDNFWAIPKCIKGEAAAILLLVPAACGIPFAWHKLHLNGIGNTFGGFGITGNGLHGFTITIPDDKKEKIRSQIKHILDRGKVDYHGIEKLIGRLGFAVQICPVYRSGLAVMYSVKSVMYKKNLWSIEPVSWTVAINITLAFGYFECLLDE